MQLLVRYPRRQPPRVSADLLGGKLHSEVILWGCQSQLVVYLCQQRHVHLWIIQMDSPRTCSAAYGQHIVIQIFFILRCRLLEILAEHHFVIFIFTKVDNFDRRPFWKKLYKTTVSKMYYLLTTVCCWCCNNNYWRLGWIVYFQYWFTGGINTIRLWTVCTVKSVTPETNIGRPIGPNVACMQAKHLQSTTLHPALFQIRHSSHTTPYPKLDHLPYVCFNCSAYCSE